MCDDNRFIIIGSRRPLEVEDTNQKQRNSRPGDVKVGIRVIYVLFFSEWMRPGDILVISQIIHHMCFQPFSFELTHFHREVKKHLKRAQKLIFAY